MFCVRSIVEAAQLARPSLISVRLISSGQDEEKSDWVAANDKVFEPLKPGEKWRPAFVCHEKRDIWYSYKKFYKVACFVRGMSVDEAVKQLSFCTMKGAKFVKEAILEAQEIAVKKHNVQYKSYLWVAESLVEKSQDKMSQLTTVRRHARGRVCQVKLMHCNYLVRLEEGHPPELYYYHQRKLSGQELLDKWVSDLRKRKVINSL